jgi:hypothetical protein
MRSISRFRRIAGRWAAAGALAAAEALAVQVDVCPAGCDFSTLQAAINAAPAGTEIVLAVSLHDETDVLIHKSLTIRGLAGGSEIRAAVAPGTENGRVFLVPAGVSVVLRDLELVNGDVAGTGDGGGVHNLGDLTLERVEIRSSGAGGGGGALFNGAGATLIAHDSTFRASSAQYGGALYNAGTATLTGCVLSQSSADSYGGAIYNLGSLALHASAVADNYASLSGGGLYQVGEAPLLSIYRGTIALNLAGSLGGGLVILNGVAELVYSDVFDNDSAYGGGVLNNATFRFRNGTVGFNSAKKRGGGLYQGGTGGSTIENATITSNSAWEDGGGIYVQSPRSVNLYSSTVAHNLADADQDDFGSGGGIFVDSACIGSPFCTTARARIRNSLITSNYDLSLTANVRPWGHECDGDLTSLGYNLVRNGSASAAAACTVISDLTGLLLGVDPLLSGPANNGGVPSFETVAWTSALHPESPAAGAGDPGGCTGAGGQLLVADQREAPRVGRCDLGAYEAGGVAGSLEIFADGFESGNTAAW